MLLQLSDLHIRAPGVLTYRRIDTSVYLRKAVDAVLKLNLPIEGIVLTGDLTDFGRPEEYAHLRTLLMPLMERYPLHLVMGNHDERTAMKAHFPDLPELQTPSFVQYTAQVGSIRLVVLDTTVPGEHYGNLCEARLTWLAQTLAQAPGQPTLIAMHHPPFDTGIGPMDRFGLLTGRDKLESLVMRHPQVQRVVCGHLHRSIQAVFGTTVAMTAPSVAHQLHFELGEVKQAAWTLEPPAVLLHVLNAQGKMVTHTIQIGTFDGPYPFWDANGQLID